MKEITLNELIEEVKEKESITRESQETTEMLKATTKEVIKASESGKIKILTDYDADGITSAYILERNIKAINPKCEVEVKCNDRRKSYGLTSFLGEEIDTNCRYIICDMGTNELDKAREHFGENVIIIDHHLTDDDKIRNQFIDNKKNNACLCNPHMINKNDKNNAQYCTAGLTYRIAQISSKDCSKYSIDLKTENSIKAMACIGTATDVVNVLDTNSYNRNILKDGIKTINNADESNFDFVLGNILARNGISEETTAHELAFKVGAFINSASRMSEIINENGSQLLYNALNGDKGAFKTYKQIEKFEEQNKERKSFIAGLTTEEYYKEFINEQRYGNNKNDNIAIYLLPDDVPSAFAGLIAGKLAETCDKAIICLTYKSDKGYYIGSGRNSNSNETSLIDFLKDSLKDTGIEITYGGHENAIGISSVKDFVDFQKIIDNNKDKILRKELEKQPILKIDLADINNPETLEKVMQLEPLGMGLEMPPLLVEGKELRRNMNFIKGREDWKRIQVKTKSENITITDWSYSPNSYPQEKSSISFLAKVSVNDFNGKHLELTSIFNRDFLSERMYTLTNNENKKKPTQIENR